MGRWETRGGCRADFLPALPIPSEASFVLGRAVSNQTRSCWGWLTTTTNILFEFGNEIWNPILGSFYRKKYPFCFSYGFPLLWPWYALVVCLFYLPLGAECRDHILFTCSPLGLASNRYLANGKWRNQMFQLLSQLKGLIKLVWKAARVGFQMPAVVSFEIRCYFVHYLSTCFMCIL